MSIMKDFKEEHATKSKSPFLCTTFNFLGLIDRHYYYYYLAPSYLYCIVSNRIMLKGCHSYTMSQQFHQLLVTEIEVMSGDIYVPM